MAPGSARVGSPYALTLALLALHLAPSHVAAQDDQAQAVQANNNSTSTVVSALILNTIIFAIEVGIFFLFRARFRKIYQPRSYLPPPAERSETQPPSLLGWLPIFLKTPNMEIMRKNGLDAYMFISFLEMMCYIFVPIWIFSWIFLMPTYAANTSGTETGFNMFTFSNVGKSDTEQKRLVAPLLAQYVCTFWMLWNIRQRVSAFIKLRQDFLVSPQHSASAQAKTILVTGIPNEILSEKKITEIYSHMPGGVAKVWLNRDLKQLPDLFDERNKLLNKLESAETQLIKLAYKRVKKGKVTDVSGQQEDTEMNADIADKYVERKQRPTHKLGKVPCMGEKVDTIEWCREEIARLNKEIDAKRADIASDYKTYAPQNSAFILFHSQIAAHMAVKTHAHHLPYRMAERFIEAHPNDIVWSNMNMNPYEKKIRNAIGWAITIAIIAFWSIPVAFIGLVSNIKGLTENVSWLRWINDIPSAVIGIIQGILPTVLLAVLNMLLPIFLRILARLSGIPTKTGIELSLQTRFFLFQIIQNFLFLTIISGSASSVPKFVQDISKNPTQFPGTLASSIPKASTFFLSFIALQGLAGSAALFAQIVPLAVYYVKKFLLASTPRKVWHIENDMGTVAWGTLFPNISLIAVIATGYLVIAPVINGFAAVTFVLFFIAYKYLFTFVYDQKPENETAGLFFPKAINHFFAGLYLEMVMLTALFFLSQSVDVDGSKKQSAIPQGAFMIILIVLVAAFHYVLHDSFGELYTALPLSIVPAYHVDAQTGHVRSSDEISGHGEKKPLMLQQHGSDLSPGYDNDAKPGETHIEMQGSTQLRAGPTAEEMEKAFLPPSLKDPQVPLWIPNDKFGIGRAGVAAARKAGLDATDDHTSVNEKGQVETDAVSPPGEALN
ncbi:DUF221-domain-containing protein [Violaceomyces palustris]|uniref:DUF221-domain-containing protein n=1 Tax=Violaceomyces palustris TaxID=1673888 RepID=A0ACD0P3S4_9BASI|nr:DUF221-domain-containing protein [Violaceomyces palustris]